MQKWLHFLAAVLALASTVLGFELQEDFERNPLDGGGGRWKVIGDAGLFQWNSLEQNLGIRWDSSRGNAFCLLPLPWPVTSEDAFAFSWDFTLNAAGARPGTARTNVLQVSVGLVRQSRIPDGYPLRTASGRAMDLVDFSFFPLADYGPFGSAAFVSPAIFGNASAGYSFGNAYDLADGQPHRVGCRWDPSARRLYTAIDGFGPVQATDPPLVSVDDFAVDAFAIIVWSETPTPRSSLLAQGTIDHVVIQLPDDCEGVIGPLAVEAAGRVVKFTSCAGYLYRLEASGTLNGWSPAGAAERGTGGVLSLIDSREALFPHQFYRVVAEKLP